MKTTENRGGSRNGAGRKPLPAEDKKIMIAIYVKKKYRAIVLKAVAAIEKEYR